MNDAWNADEIFEALGYKLVTKKEDPLIVDGILYYRNGYDEILILESCHFLKRNICSHKSEFINELELGFIIKKIKEMHKK